MGTHAEPSKWVVEQRIRNRIMEYLELAASFEEQQRYGSSAPLAYVPGEVIDQWADNFPRGLERDLPPLGVYSADEIAALRVLEPVWHVAARALSNDFPPLVAAQSLPAWGALRDAAASALGVFERRGRMSEEEATTKT